MAGTSVLQSLQAAKANYASILLLLTQVIANPTQANIDAVLQATDRSGVVRPKPTMTLDGEVYNWTEYQTAILQTYLPALNTLIQQEQSPFMIQSRWRP